jgi:glycosyltransferase involved in cell wall biosynthesis
LPRFNNYESLIKIEPTLDLRAKYKPFVFIILYIGKLNLESKLYKAIDAARFGLKNPHIGLVVLGDGPAKKEAEERAKVLGVREQVVFEQDIKDDVPYLKSANVLIVPDTSPESEEVALRGAAAGIPMILARTPAREDIFSDGESALLCDGESVDEFSLKLNILMNDISLRKQMVDSAQEMIESKFHEDPNQYLAAYRESIEQVLFLSLDKEEKEEVEGDNI